MIPLSQRQAGNTGCRLRGNLLLYEQRARTPRDVAASRAPVDERWKQAPELICVIVTDHLAGSVAKTLVRLDEALPSGSLFCRCCSQRLQEAIAESKVRPDIK